MHLSPWYQSLAAHLLRMAVLASSSLFFSSSSDFPPCSIYLLLFLSSLSISAALFYINTYTVSLAVWRVLLTPCQSWPQQMEVCACLFLPLLNWMQQLQYLIGSVFANPPGPGLIGDQLFQLSGLRLCVDYKCDGLSKMANSMCHHTTYAVGVD